MHPNSLASRAEPPRSSRFLQVASLNEIVTAARESLEPAFAHRNIIWRPGDLGNLACDPESLRQVFVYLLSNSIKFTRHCDPAVIQVGVFVLRGEQVVFVRDNGAAHHLRHEGNEGTASSLVAVADIISSHGGRVWASAEVGRDATFFFTVPAPVGAQRTVWHRPADTKGPHTMLSEGPRLVSGAKAGLLIGTLRGGQ